MDHSRNRPTLGRDKRYPTNLWNNDEELVWNKRIYRTGVCPGYTYRTLGNGYLSVELCRLESWTYIGRTLYSRWFSQNSFDGLRACEFGLGNPYDWRYPLINGNGRGRMVGRPVDNLFRLSSWISECSPFISCWCRTRTFRHIRWIDWLSFPLSEKDSGISVAGAFVIGCSDSVNSGRSKEWLAGRPLAKEWKAYSRSRFLW